MKKTTLLKSLTIGVCCVFGIKTASAQFTFANTNTLIPTATHSGCAVTVVDVNNDGLDDMLIMDQSTTLVLELQNQNGTFTRTSLANISGTTRVWGMAAADVDHNGWKDVVTGTNGTLYLVKLFYNAGTVTSTTTTLAESYFVQNVTFGDFNNDGWIDVEVNDDVDYARVYMNDQAGNLPILAHSVTSLPIGTGSKTLTVQTGLGFTAGQPIMIGFNGLNYMSGTVTSYTAGTGVMVANITTAVGTGTFAGWSVHQNVVFNMNINPGLTYGGDPYDSGNYGATWTDFDNDGDMDLYICHCRQSTNSSSDERRRDRLFVNYGNSTFVEKAKRYGIEDTTGLYKQTWTTSFGDIDNDGDLDIVMTNHGENGQILQNDGTGHFTDITAGSGFVTNVDPIESVVEDFDNDGFLDILISGGGSAGNSPWIVYKNNGNSTFTMLNAPFPPAGNGMLSFGTGDLDHDGKVDVYASYGNVYNTPTNTADVLYLNSTSNTNHFITFDLTGTVSNFGAIGARVTIYGPWGKQIREVRAGETYGTSNSMQLHFGLGANTSVDSARIDWPSHMYTNHFPSLQADQFVTVIEGGCSITGNVIPGPFVLCTGQTLTLNAAAGFTSYLWSNGSTTQSQTVSATGNYNVMVTNAAGCTNISPTVKVLLNPNQTPIVTTTGGGSNACAGAVTLTSTPSTSYAWSGPAGFTANTSSITPLVSGNYQVVTQGTCGLDTSAVTAVTVLAAPAPTGTGAQSPTPAALTLTATGTGTLSWWDMASGGTNLGSGTSYTTPVISTTTTYYVEEATTYPGGYGHTGEMYHTGPNLFNNGINGGLDFNVLSPATLVSVKVYTDSATHYGIRQFQILSSTGTVLDTVTVNVNADTTVLTLNLPLAVGNAYRITTNATVDNANFGAASPFLERSTTGVAYPYTISGLVSITNGWTGGATSNTAYYYFYDWVVQGGNTVCTSPRIPVVATIGTTGITNVVENNGISIYPNPASEVVNVTFAGASNSVALVELTDVTGRVVATWSIDKPTAGQNTKLNVSTIAAGSYLLSIKTDSKKVVQKIVLTK
jgi:ASPIC and UnbV/Secretion system C-terminal sorting domain/FG-GAP-like repeat/Ig-like domain CHU_C associated